MNKDGFIDLAEFQTGASKRVALLTEANLDRVFDVLDVDKTGQLSEATLQKAFAGEFHTQ